MLANDTDYGLAASVWSKNVDKILQVSRNVKAGRFWANTTLAGGPELPLGGLSNLVGVVKRANMVLKNIRK